MVDSGAVAEPIAFVSGRHPDGRDVVYLYQGKNEIEIDEPDLVSIARALIRHRAFVAGAAAGWTQPSLSWERTKEFLEDLIAVGFLEHEPDNPRL